MSSDQLHVQVTTKPLDNIMTLCVCETKLNTKVGNHYKEAIPLSFRGERSTYY